MYNLILKNVKNFIKTFTIFTKGNQCNSQLLSSNTALTYTSWSSPTPSCTLTHSLRSITKEIKAVITTVCCYGSNTERCSHVRAIHDLSISWSIQYWARQFCVKTDNKIKIEASTVKPVKVTIYGPEGRWHL